MYCSKCRAPRTDDQIGREQEPSGDINYFCIPCQTTLETRQLCGPCGGVEKGGVVTLNGAGQIVRACPTCSSPMGLALSRPLAATGKTVGAESNEAVRPTVQMANNEILARRQDRGASHPPPIAAASRAPHAATTLAHGALNAGSIEDTIRARLAIVELEIATRKGLEVEARTLRKMLAASERVSAQAAAKVRVASLVAAPPPPPEAHN